MNDKKLTVKRVKADLALIGIRIRKTDAGDFRVAHSLTEAGGYYTTDLQDALDTGKAMAKDRDHKAAQAAGPVALLKFHVSGAIARGEGVAIVGIQAKDTNETFTDYLHRVGKDHDTSGAEFTAQDYHKAAKRITELERELSGLRNAIRTNERHDLNDLRTDIILPALDVILADKFQHLEERK